MTAAVNCISILTESLSWKAVETAASLNHELKVHRYKAIGCHLADLSARSKGKFRLVQNATEDVTSL